MNKPFGFVLALAPIALVAGCGQGGSGGSAPSAPTGSANGKAAPSGEQWVDVVSKTPDGGYVMGNPDAPLKVIEYGARSCPHCAHFDKEGFPALKANYIASGKVSYEFRDFPVHGPLDIPSILLGQCVETAQFFPMLDQMMRNQDTLLGDLEKKLTPADQQAMQTKSPNDVATMMAEKLGYLDFVKQRGVPEAKARACLADKAALDTLAKNLQTADQQFQVAYTPTFILNGKKLDGVDTWEKLEPALKKAGA